MEDGKTTTTQPATGSPDGTGSQDAGKTGQPGNQDQNAGTPKVEGGEQHTSSQTSGRPKPSDFYEARKADKQWKASLEGQVQQLSGQLQEIGSVLKELKQKPPDEPKFLTEVQMQELLLTDPAKWASEREKQMQYEVQKSIKQVKEVEVPKILQQHDDKKQKEQKDREFETAKQEALELMFPKSGTDDARDLKARMKAMPERYERIDQLLEETGLDDILVVDPVKAAKGVLKVLELEAKLQRTNPGVPTKGQLSAVTPTGTRSEEHTSELQSLAYLVCRLLLEKKTNNTTTQTHSH